MAATSKILASIAGVVAILTALVFLSRQRQRVKELRWQIPKEVDSFYQNMGGTFQDRTGKRVTLDNILEVSTDKVLMQGFLDANFSSGFECSSRIRGMYEDFIFWGRVVGWFPRVWRVGRKPQI